MFVCIVYVLGGVCVCVGVHAVFVCVLCVYVGGGVHVVCVGGVYAVCLCGCVIS